MDIDRLGYYLVGQQKFHNKTLALIESRRVHYQPVWVFNDDAYSNIDWRIPIDESLPNIYRRRALQLREKYDYLVLYFSGGADSTNILNTFLENNIFLDEIVMQIPEPMYSKTSSTNLSGDNIHSEIKYAAEVYLQNNSSRINGRTKIRYQDYAKPVVELLKNEDWPDLVPMGTHITLGALGKQMAQVTETHIQKLCEQNFTVAQILGIDKPMVYYNGQNYYAYFLDLNTRHAPPVDNTYSEIFNSLYCTEFFYWTPDMPEIVVKQAQEIKRECELDHAKKQLWSKARILHSDKFRNPLNPIIYPDIVAPVFQTGKPTSHIIRNQDAWFWENMDAKIKDSYTSVITHLKNNINNYHFIDNDIMKGLQGHPSREYPL